MTQAALRPQHFDQLFERQILMFLGIDDGRTHLLQ